MKKFVLSLIISLALVNGLDARVKKYDRKSHWHECCQCHRGFCNDNDDNDETVIANAKNTVCKCTKAESSSETGIVYLITNHTYALWNGEYKKLYKIGTTGRTIENRLKELSSTSSPFQFEVIDTIHSNRYEEIEKDLHCYFAMERVNPKREFFISNPDSVKKKMTDFQKHYWEKQ